ncbi:MAG: Trk system potassium transporter TrkA [Bacteroidales bacterium]|nr:Trk system potassium transporter TrkA [Bacteroidales bacterium]
MKIVIEGAGEVGRYLAQMLSREANEITLVDCDGARLAKATAIADVATIEGPSSSVKTLKEARVGEADLFIAVNPSVPQQVNIVSALVAHNLGAKRVSVRIDDEEYLTPENKYLFKQIGIEIMFFPERIAADEIVDQLKHSAASESMDFANGKLQISVFKIDENSELMKPEMNLMKFGEIAARENLQFRVIAISRNEQTIMPNPTSRFKYHDLVFAIANKESMPKLVELMGKSNLEISRLMIFGGTEMGEQVAKVAGRQIKDIKIIEKNRARCLELIEMFDSRVTVVNGDARDADVLVEENIHDYDAFAALSESDEMNMLACLMAKKFGVKHTIADIENVEYIRLAEEMGVDTVINKKLLTVGRIFKFTLSGKARSVKYMGGTTAEVLEYTVSPDSKITRCALKDMGFPKNAVVGGVIRGSDAFIAVGDTVIEPYDRVAVFALKEAVKEVDTFFK